MTGKRRRLGQGMTEYIVIVALIAVAAIGVYRYFGSAIRNQVAGMAQEIAGQDASSQIAGAQTAATSANTQATANKTLNSYNGN